MNAPLETLMVQVLIEEVRGHVIGICAIAGAYSVRLAGWSYRKGGGSVSTTWMRAKYARSVGANLFRQTAEDDNAVSSHDFALVIPWWALCTACFICYQEFVNLIGITFTDHTGEHASRVFSNTPHKELVMNNLHINDVGIECNCNKSNLKTQFTLQNLELSFFYSFISHDPIFGTCNQEICTIGDQWPYDSWVNWC